MNSNVVDVSIIYVNFKTNELLENSIESVKKLSSGFSFEIIVVDNSCDEEVFFDLKNRFDDSIKLIKSEKNIGFGKANNLGVLNAHGKYLFFLNTDTLLINNAIYILLSFLKAHSNTGIVGPSLFTKTGSPNHSFFKRKKTIKNDLYNKGIFSSLCRQTFKRRDDFNYSKKPLLIKGYVCGASLMISKSFFDTIGGFDKDIFMYAEEALLCYKAIYSFGKRIYNVPAAKIMHFEGASYNNLSSMRAKNIVDGNYLFYLKAYGKEQGRLYLTKMVKTFERKKAILSFLNIRTVDSSLMIEALKAKIRDLQND